MVSINDIDIEKINQVVEPESQETHVSIDYFERKINVYTNKATVIKRMLKKGYRPIRLETMQGKICSMQFEFSTKDVSKILRADIFKFD